ncbi:MAG TPA: hypothetical protein VJO52_08180 [Gemmatimonadaceae bacterium]|nr:hypothetical protein [Gemmatimonadaceae bacterium]
MRLSYDTPTRAEVAVSDADAIEAEVKLFWLSLAPLVTRWMRREPFCAGPDDAVCDVLLLSAVAYLLLQRAILRTKGSGSMLATALGSDREAKISVLVYVAAIPLALVRPWIAGLLYAVVEWCSWFGIGASSARLRARGGGGQRRLGVCACSPIHDASAVSDIEQPPTASITQAISGSSASESFAEWRVRPARNDRRSGLRTY